MTKAYLLGVLHDSTTRKTTYRIASKSLAFCEFLKKGIHTLGSGAWIYKEGKDRSLWIVEFPQTLLKGVAIKSEQKKTDYIRGFFDAEGGVAKSSKVRYYLYFCQKDLKDLLQVKGYLEELGIVCGKLHNPSKRVDPSYWRFFLSVKSYGDFAKIIGSSHPEKSSY